MLPRYSHTAVETFAELIPVIVKSLIDIALTKDTVQRNSKTIADASGLLSAIEKWSFQVALDSGVCRKFSWGFGSGSYGGHLYLVFAVCDVTI